MVLKKEKESAKKVSKTTKDKADKSVVPKSAKSKTITKSKAEYIPKEGRMARRFNKLRIKGDENSKRGVVYIGHLTKGFNEEELKKFFGQFGTVSKLRVARSKTSGRSKGYAFL
jgi:nucleolar protein 15